MGNDTIKRPDPKPATTERGRVGAGQTATAGNLSAPPAPGSKVGQQSPGGIKVGEQPPAGPKVGQQSPAGITVREPPSPNRPPLNADERRARISAGAYRNAERRGFKPGSEVDDWLAAERELDAAGPSRSSK